jgi:vacuolar-type H+-ATPase subunit I/STV1
VVPRGKLEDFGSILQKSEVRLQRIPPWRGTPPQVLSGLEKELSEAQSQLERIEARLRELSARYLGSLYSIEEQLSI